MMDAPANGSTPNRIPLTADERSSVVIEVEELISGYTEEDVLCILMTATVNAIHVNEDGNERRRLEHEYIKALRFLSAVEEQFHAEIVGEIPDRIDVYVSTMMRHVFRAIGGI
jgi:hypothetical protein